MHNYLICGLSVASELELPGAIPQSAPATPADVSIRRATLPTALGDAPERGPNWQIAGESILLHVPKVARFQITDGRDIAVEIAAGSREQDAGAYALGAVFGILMHQRGALVLHGSAVARNGEAIAICGHSGAGKSTLAAALCRAGATFVTDDICAIDFDGHGRPCVFPDGRRLKLWQESIDKLDFAK